jgi:hypothetical protein
MRSTLGKLKLKFSGGKMEQFFNSLKELKEMPLAALGTAIVLGAFALAAFAIHTMGKISGGPRGRK